MQQAQYAPLYGDSSPAEGPRMKPEIKHELGPSHDGHNKVRRKWMKWISMVAAVVALTALTAMAALWFGTASFGRMPYPFTNRHPACTGLPSWSVLREALRDSVKASGGPSNGGLDGHMWAVLVEPASGSVCAVAYSGMTPMDQWGAGRFLAAGKAFLVNSLSLNDFAVSSAQVYGHTQPGGMMYGAHAGMPLDSQAALAGNPLLFGRENDPMVGQRVGGAVSFGGGLPLYAEVGGTTLKVGALGVSGDTSCSDHIVAWRVRERLGLAVPKGGNVRYLAGKTDALMFGNEGSIGHANCEGNPREVGKSIGAVVDSA